MPWGSLAAGTMNLAERVSSQNSQDLGGARLPLAHLVVMPLSRLSTEVGPGEQEVREPLHLMLLRPPSFLPDLL